ncbi:MAG: amino acid permease [Chloroflexi bacterium]|nr:amino acid permease [Chloroflexota bacterium]MBT4072842.1 amino acid permease [Chloroflexota bacterium]MBT4513776.1 amino acid permease [Chloroflexota bacterium]MBT6682356.1 amino acid permease [Chloroflexota bacterium]
MADADTSRSLARRVSTFELAATGVGVILGAGIYVLLGEAAGQTGGAVWIPFALAALAASLTGLTYAELASSFPSSAASFEFARRAFGNRLGFVTGWTMLFAMTIPAAAVGLGFAGYMGEFVGLPSRLMAIVLILLSAAVLVRGVTESVRIGVSFAMIEAIGLLLVVTVSVPFIGIGPDGGSVDYLHSPDGLGGVFATTALVFFAFLGFEQIANLGEEAKNPQRGLPIAIVTSILITSVVYILVTVSAVSVVAWEELSESSAPLSLVVRKATGADLANVLSVIALFATANTVLFTMLAGSRAVYGMARDGSLPTALAGVRRKQRTPWVAVMVISVVAILFTLIGDIGDVADLTNASVLFAFAVVNAALIRIRLRGDVMPGAFHTPLSFRRVPLVPVLGLAISIGMMVYTGFEAVVFLIGLVLLGLIIDLVLNRRRSGTNHPEILSTTG